MRLTHLIREAWVSILRTNVTWLCAALIVLPGYVSPVRRQLTPLVCAALLLEIYLFGLGAMGLIRIASRPNAKPRVTVRDVLLPGRPTADRFFALLILKLVALVPVLILIAFVYVSIVYPELPISRPLLLLSSVPVLLGASFVLTVLGVAQRQVVLANSGITAGLTRAWRLTAHNAASLLAAFGLAFVASVFGPAVLAILVARALGQEGPLTHGLGLLVSMIAAPFGSALCTRAYVAAAANASRARSSATA